MYDIIKFPTGGYGLISKCKTYFLLFNFKTKTFKKFDYKVKERLYSDEFKCYIFKHIVDVNAELNNRFIDATGEENNPF